MMNNSSMVRIVYYDPDPDPLFIVVKTRISKVGSDLILHNPGFLVSRGKGRKDLHYVLFLYNLILIYFC